MELLYSIQTDGYVWINGIPHSFRDGDLIVVNSRDPHSLLFLGENEHICMKFLPQILYAEDQALFELKYVLPFLNQDTHKTVFHPEDLKGTDIHRLITEIMSEWEARSNAYELIIRADILKIIATLLRHWDLNAGAVRKQYLTDAMRRALPFISENYNTITEKDAADHCNLSYHHFSFAFKQLMGKNFSEYLTSIKIKEAEKMLLTTDHSITDIAYETGFSNVSHFISRFRQYKGITPAKFRKHVIIDNMR